MTVWDAVAATPVQQFSVAASRRPGPLPRGLPPPEVWAVVVALSADGSRAAAVTIEGTVYVWDMVTGEELLVDAHPEAGRSADRLAAIRRERPTARVHRRPARHAAVRSLAKERAPRRRGREGLQHASRSPTTRPDSPRSRRRRRAERSSTTSKSGGCGRGRLMTAEAGRAAPPARAAARRRRP